VADADGGQSRTIQARALINASGPWMEQTMDTIEHGATRKHIRMVKGSHIITRRLFDHEYAYIFQNSDGRIVFAIPYAGDFTLIGTTDVDFHGDPARVAITAEEIDYLCAAASEYFKQPINPSQVVTSFAGIRPLFDDGSRDAKAATRDYVLSIDSPRGKAPLLAIYGGKITTYRKLAEAVLQKLVPFLPQMGPAWTENRHLPGGDFRPDQFNHEMNRLLAVCPLLQKKHARRLVRTYGTRAFPMVQGIRIASDFGTCFGDCLYEFEVVYLMQNEWARTAEDVLWRRTNMGLFLSTEERQNLDTWMKAHRHLRTVQAPVPPEGKADAA
jgi:glycerol-3-phosphate dehydrogenase